MTTATESIPSIHESSLQRVSDYPVVKQTLLTAYNIVHSNSYASKAYDTATSLSESVLARLAPVLPIERVDGIANKTLDYVEKRFPVVKEETDVLVQRVRAPADGALGVAKTYADGLQSRFSPVTEQISHRIAQAQEKIQVLQDSLFGVVAAVPRDKAGSVQEAIQKLYTEFESISIYVGSTIKELPANAQTASKPYLDGLSDGVSHLREELAKDTPWINKAQNMANYTKEKLSPILVSIKDQIHGATEKGAAEINGTS